MPKKPAQRSSLFLLELIIAILFFILAATACVRIFVSSHQLEKDSLALDQAVFISTSMADLFRSEEDLWPMLSRLYPEGDLQSETTFTIYYDNNWEPCSASEAVYMAFLETEYTQDYKTGHIRITEDDSCIYELTVDKYLPQPYEEVDGNED